MLARNVDIIFGVLLVYLNLPSWHTPPRFLSAGHTFVSWRLFPLTFILFTAMRLLHNLGSRRSKRFQSERSTHEFMRPFARQSASLSSTSPQRATPFDLFDSGLPTHSRGSSTSSVLSSSRKKQHGLDLLSDPSDVLDIRPMLAELADTGSIDMRSPTSEPESTLEDLPPAYTWSPADDSPPPMYTHVAPVYEAPLSEQEVTALLRALRAEQTLQLKASNGFAGFTAAELEMWEERMD